MFGGETTNNYKHNPRNARVDNVPTAAVTLIQSGILPNSFSDICDHGLLKKFPAFLVFIQLAALRDSGGSSSSLKTTLNVVNRENRTSRINNERANGRTGMAIYLLSANSGKLPSSGDRCCERNGSLGKQKEGQ